MVASDQREESYSGHQIRISTNGSEAGAELESIMLFWQNLTKVSHLYGNASIRPPSKLAYPTLQIRQSHVTLGRGSIVTPSGIRWI